jgi:hypothetical protein
MELAPSQKSEHGPRPSGGEAWSHGGTGHETARGTRRALRKERASDRNASTARVPDPSLCAANLLARGGGCVDRARPALLETSPGKSPVCPTKQAVLDWKTYPHCNRPRCVMTPVVLSTGSWPGVTAVSSCRLRVLSSVSEALPGSFCAGVTGLRAPAGHRASRANRA